MSAAAVYNMTRDVWHEGLCGSSTCDEAVLHARALAAQGSDVVLWDDGTALRFSPQHEGVPLTREDLLDLSLDTCV